MFYATEMKKKTERVLSVAFSLDQFHTQTLRARHRLDTEAGH